jgi:hypothetical protein
MGKLQDASQIREDRDSDAVGVRRSGREFNDGEPFGCRFEPDRSKNRTA